MSGNNNRSIWGAIGVFFVAYMILVAIWGIITLSMGITGASGGMSTGGLVTMVAAIAVAVYWYNKG